MFLPEGKPVVWLPVPAEGNRVTVTTLFAAAGVRAEDWTRTVQPGHRLIGRLGLENGDTFGLVASEDPMSTEEAEWVAGFVRETRVHPGPGDSLESIQGATIFAVGEMAGQPSFMNFGLGKENVSRR
jgi:hypothetical protein